MKSQSIFWITAITLIALFTVTLYSCSDDDTEPDSKWLNNIDALLEHNLERVRITEGLAGTVIFTEGNCMPQPVDDEEMESSCLRYPVSRVVQIREYTHRSKTEHQGGGFHTNVQTKLIAKVQTDAAGFFEVDLPPGNYSLFIKEQGSLYANLWNSEGFIQAATVTEGDAVFVTLDITHSAYY